MSNTFIKQLKVGSLVQHYSYLNRTMYILKENALDDVTLSKDLFTKEQISGNNLFKDGKSIKYFHLQVLPVSNIGVKNRNATTQRIYANSKTYLLFLGYILRFNNNLYLPIRATQMLVWLFGAQKLITQANSVITNEFSIISTTANDYQYKIKK